MNTLTRLSLACASLCLPVMVAAAAPASVTGITATLQSGKVLVTWTPITDQTISAYRVFFSHASILSSSGLYDDYDTVEGSVNSYSIVNTPQSDRVYVSVLAVNEQGEESPYFAEEASVQLSGNAASSAMSVDTLPASSAAAIDTTPTPAVSDSNVRLLSVNTLSATGVVLTFSQNVTIDPALALNTFTIQNASGSLLTITRLSVLGNTVQLDTFPQERNVVYALIVGPGISGVDPKTNATVPLDPAQAPMLFSGDPMGIETMIPSVSSAASSAVPTAPVTHNDVSALVVRAQAESKKGLYTIQATWQIPADNTLAGFQISQTTDRGRTFSNTRTLEKTTGGVSIPHVPAGNFGLMVRAVYTDGSLSSGVQKMVDLPGAAPANPLQGNVGGKPSTSGHLPNSGTGELSVLLMLGSAAGYALMKRYQKTVA